MHDAFGLLLPKESGMRNYCCCGDDCSAIVSARWDYSRKRCPCRACHSELYDLLDLQAWAILLRNGKLFRKVHFDLILQCENGIRAKVIAFLESWEAWMGVLRNYTESGEWACRWISSSPTSLYICISRSA